jgi:hypothetical protein
MAVVRSPNYPQIDLGTAIEAVRTAFTEEGRNRMSKEVLSKHLGYTSVNGRALAKIGAVRAYGLIEGKENELRISDDAKTLLIAPLESSDRTDAVQRCAFKPPIFNDIRASFETTPSEHNLRYHLAKKDYTLEAAGKAAKNYLATVRLVEEAISSYHPGEVEEDDAAMQEAVAATALQPASPAATREQIRSLAPPAAVGMRQAVFTLEEGDVTLTFPDSLSAESYAELSEYLAIFLRRAQRQKAGTTE